MPPPSLNREFAFMLNDVARLLRTYADYKASQFGMTRAQWAVLVRVDRSKGSINPSSPRCSTCSPSRSRGCSTSSATAV